MVHHFTQGVMLVFDTQICREPPLYFREFDKVTVFCYPLKPHGGELESLYLMNLAVHSCLFLYYEIFFFKKHVSSSVEHESSCRTFACDLDELKTKQRVCRQNSIQLYFFNNFRPRHRNSGKVVQRQFRNLHLAQVEVLDNRWL